MTWFAEGSIARTSGANGTERAPNRALRLLALGVGLAFVSSRECAVHRSLMSESGLSVGHGSMIAWEITRGKVEQVPNGHISRLDPTCPTGMRKL